MFERAVVEVLERVIVARDKIRHHQTTNNQRTNQGRNTK